MDWWWGGNLLLGRYPINTDAGRLKWWRKKCREGVLPPVLVWYIAGLASFVILDGHYRLQAAIAEGIPPHFLVLRELHERGFPSDFKEIYDANVPPTLIFCVWNPYAKEIKFIQ